MSAVYAPQLTADQQQRVLDLIPARHGDCCNDCDDDTALYNTVAAAPQVSAPPPGAEPVWLTAGRRQYLRDLIPDPEQQPDLVHALTHPHTDAPAERLAAVIASTIDWSRGEGETADGAAGRVLSVLASEGYRIVAAEPRRLTSLPEAGRT